MSEFDEACTHGSSRVSCEKCLNEYIDREERLSLVENTEEHR